MLRFMFKAQQQFVYIVLFLNLITVSLSANSKNNFADDDNQNLFFNSLSVNNSLSQNSITSILQDKQGFIWIGTYDGLNRFDGFNVEIKRHESNNPSSLSDNRILSLCNYDKNQILIGTDGGGLDVFNTGTDLFSHIELKNNENYIESIKTICVDRKGLIWIGGKKGITVINLNKNCKLQESRSLKLFKGKQINKIYRDLSGNIWIGTTYGLYFINNNSGYPEFEKPLLIKEVGLKDVSCIIQDKDYNLWVGGEKNLAKLSFKNKQLSGFFVYQFLYSTFFKVLKNEFTITDIKVGFDGNIWLSTLTDGIIKCNDNKYGSINIIASYNTKKRFCNLSENLINCIFIDQSNTLWVGTFQKGVNYTSLTPKNIFNFFPLTNPTSYELGYKGKYITNILEDKTKLWLGTLNEGLYRFDEQKNELIKLRAFTSKSVLALYKSKFSNKIFIGGSEGLYYSINPSEKIPVFKKLLNGLAIRSICEDDFKNLWLATWSGIFIWNIKTNSLKKITENDGLSSNTGYVLYQDPNQKVIWYGTIGGGLNRIEYNERQQLKFKYYKHQEGKADGLSSNHIWSIFIDSNKQLWLGTDAGLNLFQNNKFTQVKNLTLKDRKIMAIQEDFEKNLWLNSSQGLFRYNHLNNSVKQFTFKDGLQSNSLTEAVFKTDDGKIYFGGINGLNYLYPDKLSTNPYLSQTAFVDFKIFNQSVYPKQKIDGRIILNRDINSVKKIFLSYKENNFLLTFASLHYAHPEDNLFRYKLFGYDKNYIITSSKQRFAAYSNLDPGAYKFVISSSNNDGLWSKDIRTIEFLIEPAPWLTWWAKMIYFGVISAILYLLFMYIQSRRKLKKQIFLEKYEKEKIMELNELKLNFFTSITHEIRSPINLILGPIEDLASKYNSNDTYASFRIDIIRRNALKLLNLINQVLDLRKINSNHESLHIEEGNLMKLLVDIKSSFQLLAETRNISFELSYEDDKLSHYFDKDKIEKILNNLISNAFNYCSDEGKVVLDLKFYSGNAQISVSDTGKGIAADELEKIFDMYYRGENKMIGSGVGLSLSKKLLEIHKGKFIVESQMGIGSTFTIIFPVKAEAYNLLDIIINSDVSISKNSIENTKLFSEQKVKKNCLLIVDDDIDLRNYIKESLKDEYQIIQAHDGESGLALALKHLPQIILTDLMMKGMNGFELIEKLKADVKTNYIPVIAHSVKFNVDTHEKVMKIGADDFIAKPFDYKILKMKINNLLYTRSKFVEYAYLNNILTPTELSIPSEDEELLKKILRCIEENISDANFNVEMLSAEIGMSRMSLHRKLHAILGKTTSEVIKEVRMKIAGQLLASGSYRISEAMVEVGISSNTYFNKYFKEMYGETAKEFINDKKVK